MTQTSACPNGLLATDGSSAASVTLYWGPADGGADTAAWANAAVFGANAQPTPTAYTTNLTGLASGATYYYRYYAVNNSGSVWASPSVSFTTMGVPVVDNTGGATKVFSSTATLNGTVISGIPAPSVYICWGTADGGAATTDAWQNAVALGVQSGAFSTSLSGLMPGTAYYYRCYATNSEGAAWASASVSFNDGLLDAEREHTVGRRLVADGERFRRRLHRFRVHVRFRRPRPEEYGVHHHGASGIRLSVATRALCPSSYRTR